MTLTPHLPLRSTALGAALLCAAAAAQAQQAWVLTTDETNATYRNNIFAAVENAYGVGNVIDGRTALNSSTPLGALPADVNLVVIGMLGTNTTGLNADRWAEVQSLIAAPGRELTVAWFIDGAVSARHANSGELLSLLNDQLGYTGTADAMGTVLHNNATGGSTFHRNPTTALSAGLPDTLGGGVYTAFRNVFGQYTIYLEGGPSNPAPTIPATNTEKTSPGAYGLMLPRAALQNQQTCVFAFGDISPFSTASARINTLMAGIGAAAGTGGLCTSTAVPHPDLVPTVTAPSGLVAGGTGTVVVDVRNQGLVDSTDGSLTINLPAGLEIDPAGTLPAGCTATSSTAVSCTLSAIAAGTSTSLSLPVLATAPIATAQPITATVQSVTGELAPQQSNNAATAPVTVGAAPVVPVVDLTPSVVSAPSSLTVGQNGVVTLRVINNGTAASTDGVFVIDLPAGLQVPATATLPTGCTRTSATQVSCNLGALAAGGGFSDFNIPVEAISPTAAGAQLSATVSAVTGEPAANQGNNAATTPVTVGAAPVAPVVDLTPSVVSAPSSLTVGQNGVVTLRVINNGTAASTDGVFVIDLPAGLQVPATATLPTGCTRTSATQVSCNLGALAAGGGFSDFSIPVEAISPTAAGAQLSATVSAVTGEPAANQGNNAATTSLTVAQLATTAAVPTLGAWGLGALAAALGVLGVRRRLPKGKPTL